MEIKNKQHPSMLINGVADSRILRLALSQKAFEITGTAEKMFELRNPSPWINSRLVDKQGNMREYDFVLLTLGYGNSLPWKLLKCGKFELTSSFREWTFSNGVQFLNEQGGWMIHLYNINKQQTFVEF